MNLGGTFRLADRPWGMRCAVCRHVFGEGERYLRQPLALTADSIPIYDVVCFGCAQGEVVAEIVAHAEQEYAYWAPRMASPVKG